MTGFLSLILALLGVLLVFLATEMAPNLTWPTTSTEYLATLYLFLGLILSMVAAYLASSAIFTE